MVQQIAKTTVWFKDSNKTVGYYDPQTETYVEVGEVEKILEMLINKLNFLVGEVNSIQQKKVK